jgi:hypothetical protein
MLLAALALPLSVATAASSGAQESVLVTVVNTDSGAIDAGCGSEGPIVSDDAVFVITRTGDTTGTLTVSVAWSGTLIEGGTTVLPTSVHFAAGSETVTVSPVFAPIPTHPGGITLTVTSGAGYQPGEPTDASTTYEFRVPSCPPPPRGTVPVPLAIQASPNFTG